MTDINKNMLLVKSGTFKMGNTTNSMAGFDDELPIHKVKLTYDFWVGKYPVTFKKFDKYCEEANHSKVCDEGWGRGKRPAINLSWYDAIGYCNWLSISKGLPKAYNLKGNLLDENAHFTTDITKVKGYRLLTEAEWEYVARAGQENSCDVDFSESKKLDQIAWYGYNSGGKTHKVGKKKPNELGIYDMFGNVWEWCYDWWEESFYRYCPEKNPISVNADKTHVVRGGCWTDDSLWFRASVRGCFDDHETRNYLGFRIARTDN
jgi:formylglycine-generating enzyme required for sulfatase activity